MALDSLRTKLAEVRRKARRDVRGADRKAAQLAQDERVKRATRGAREAATGARERLAEAGSNLEDVSEQTGASASDEVADRARKAGEARAPVDASLDPVGDPRGIESMARADGMSTDEQPRDAAGDGMADLIFGSGGVAGQSSGPGAMSDAMGVSAGMRLDLVGMGGSPDQTGRTAAQESDASAPLEFDDTWGVTGGDNL